MEAAGLAVDALGRVRDMVHDALKDLSPKEILARPDHTSRGWCGIVPRAGRKFFSNDGPFAVVGLRWMARALNMLSDPKDYRSGHRQTRAQVEAFQVTDKPLLLDYLDAVFAQPRATSPWFRMPI